MDDLEDAHRGFTEMFDELAPRVFAYARRHCDAVDAQDVVSDTFLVARRRWSAVPDSPLPWLLTVARNTISNRRRHAVRQDRLAQSLGRLADLMPALGGAEHNVVERETMLEALGELSELEREALLLVAWDGLTGLEAAKVAGCTPHAFEVRLSRARARLARSISAHQPHNVGHQTKPQGILRLAQPEGGE